MSGRHRRPEAYWVDKEEKRPSAKIHSNISPGRSQNWSKSEVHDDLMHDSFSRSPSRDGPRDDDMRRDRSRMYSHPKPDEWEKQYSTHPSDESYGMPYRSRDKGVGGNVRMSREQERTRSPNRSRSRSWDRVSRGSRESTRGPRHESNASYPNMRNDSEEFDSRGGGNNRTESWTRRTDYKGGGPRHNDYRNTRIPCKYFAAGNCNRDDCRFSHDVPEAARGFDDNRNLGNKNRACHNDRQPRDDLNVEANLGEMEKKKSWNSAGWNDVESGGFNETSRQDHTLDDGNNDNAWDSRDDKKKLSDGHASQDASGFHDVGKSHPNLDNKKSSWNGPASWDGVSGAGFSSASNPCHRYEETAKESLNDNNVKGRMSANPGGNIDRHKTKKWDGPLWDGFSETVVDQTDDIKVRKWDGPGLSKMASRNAENAVNDSSLNNIVSENDNQQILTSGHDLSQSVQDMNTQSLSYLHGPLNGQGQGMYVHMENQNEEGGKPLKPLEMDVPQPPAVNYGNETSLTCQLAPQANALPADISHKVQLSQFGSNLTDAIDYLKSLPSSAYNQDTRANEEQNSVRNMEILSGSVTQQNQTPADPTHDSSKHMKKEAVEEIDKRVAKDTKKEENTNLDNADPHGKVEEGDIGNDEKAMRQFKVGLVEFVKEILKPKWKEGKMSRDVHKTVVKKVVEKVTSTIQGSQIPRTQPKIDQYLAYSKPKITKLVEAYMERLVKS